MGYNMAVIRKLLDASFTDEDLSNFCHDYFHEIYEQFTAGQTKSARVRLLIDYSDHRGRLDELLEKVKQENPYKFEEFESQLKGGDDTNQSTGLDEQKPFSWGEFAGKVLKKFTDEQGLQSQHKGQQWSSSLDQIFQGRWEMQLIDPIGMVGKATAEFHENGMFRIQGISPIGMFHIEGTWQIIQADEVVLNGIQQTSYQTMPYATTIHFSHISSNTLSGMSSEGEQISLRMIG